MAWTLPWPRKALASAGPELHDEDAWSRHVTTLAAHGIPEPGTVADDRATAALDRTSENAGSLIIVRVIAGPDTRAGAIEGGKFGVADSPVPYDAPRLCHRRGTRSAILLNAAGYHNA